MSVPKGAPGDVRFEHMPDDYQGSLKSHAFRFNGARWRIVCNNPKAHVSCDGIKKRKPKNLCLKCAELLGVR